MTLNDIIVSALAQLDRGHDAQSLDVWRDKLARFANDAVLDLAEAFRLRRTESVVHENGLFFLSALSHACLSVLSVSQNGKNLNTPFLRQAIACTCAGQMLQSLQFATALHRNL